VSEIKVDTVGPRVDSGTLTIGAAGDTVNIAGTAGTGFPTPTTGIAASAITTGTMATARLGSGTASSSTFLRGDQTYAAAGGDNTPTFSAKSTANQTGISNGGWTKIQFDTATFNVGSNYDATNDKFVAPSNGKYFFTASLKINSAGGSATLIGTGCRFTISGTTAGDNLNFIANGSLSAMSATNSMILNLTTNQYVEVYAYYQDNGGGTGSVTGSSDKSTQFYGCKLIT